MKYVITGAGLVGSSVARALARDHQLVVIDIATPQRDVPGTFVQANLLDLDRLRSIVRGSDGILHTAALHAIHMQSHTTYQFFETNALGTFSVLEAAHQESVPRVVFSSTNWSQERADGILRVRGPSDRCLGGYYGVTKALAEQTCEFYRRCKGVDVISLRYGAIRQLVNTFSERLPVAWAVSGILTDLRDVVRANVAAITMPTLPERPAWPILPTTVVDEDAIARHGGFEQALQARLPWLDGRDLTIDPDYPLCVYDAAATESALGIRIAYGQEEFLREALGLIDAPPLDAPDEN